MQLVANLSNQICRMNEADNVRNNACAHSMIVGDHLGL